MAKKKSIAAQNAEAMRYAIQGGSIKAAYRKYLDERGLKDSYGSADRFAAEKTAAGTASYYGRNEKEIIILLAGYIDPNYG